MDVKFTRKPGDPPHMTDEQWARLVAMTDEEVEAAALSDPDCPPLTEEQLARWMRRKPMT